jgi:hypothetical protein
MGFSEAAMGSGRLGPVRSLDEGGKGSSAFYDTEDGRAKRAAILLLILEAMPVREGIRQGGQTTAI